MFIEISNNLKKLSKYFPEGLYIVGGYVRNKILKLECSDVDLASNVDIEEVTNRLKESGYSVKIKNLRLGSLLISKDDENYEYTAFRKEGYEEDGRHCPSKVEKTENIEEDSSRRDFTINAIYYNINKDEITDLHHGIVDLNQKIIRCTLSPEEVLRFDGERILRMVRIAGELDFSIDKPTLRTAIKYAKNVNSITGARKFSEIEKILFCDKRYALSKGSLKRALNLLNVLNIWQFFGLKTKKLNYRMVYKVEDRFLGFLIDIVDTEKPECLETFLDKLLKEQFGLSQVLSSKVFVLLSGYYNALNGMKNKEYFFRYFENWANIYSLLGGKSKRIQNKYNFFYQYIIEYGLAIRISDLCINENDIKENFKNIDKRNYNRILNNLLSKVFDGKLQNEKSCLLKEIEKTCKTIDFQ